MSIIISIFSFLFGGIRNFILWALNPLNRIVALKYFLAAVELGKIIAQKTKTTNDDVALNWLARFFYTSTAHLPPDIQKEVAKEATKRLGALNGFQFGVDTAEKAFTVHYFNGENFGIHGAYSPVDGSASIGVQKAI